MSKCAEQTLQDDDTQSNQRIAENKKVWENFVKNLF